MSDLAIAGNGGGHMEGIPADALWERWDHVNFLSVQLADQIEAHCIQTSEQFDGMIVIPRGSYFPVNIIARRLGFKATHLQHMGMTSYPLGQTERSDVGFEYGQMPLTEHLKDKDWLIIEEVCDTGHTLSHAVDLLRHAKAGLIRTGALHYKPERSQTGFVPDWVPTEPTDRWIVYPWEVDERIGLNSVVRRKSAEEIAAEKLAAQRLAAEKLTVPNP